MHSNAKTVKQYISELPTERKEAIATVRKAIFENLPDGYEEVMNWGMITYQVPLKTYPDTYNKKPLMYAALASQKNHMAVYMSGIYMYEEARNKFETEYKATGNRFDAGKSCVQFRKLDDLPVDLISKSIAPIQVEELVNQAKKVHSQH